MSFNNFFVRSSANPVPPCLPNSLYLAKPFTYYRIRKICGYDFHILQRHVGEDEFRVAPFGKRQIIGQEGRKPSGQKELICTG
jgi:hypothetical protein